MTRSLPLLDPRSRLLQVILFLIVLSAIGPIARAAGKVVFSSSYPDLADFERFATRAKQSGATHIDVAQSLPWSYWEYDRTDDPYPSWDIWKGSGCGK